MANRSPPIPARVLENIRSSIIRRTGLSPQNWVLEARIGERMLSTGIDQPGLYLDLLETQAELIEIVELLRVGETRFFRHGSHMKAMNDLVLPALRKGSGEARVWSAGCATGEEAYTLAMMLSRGLEGHREVSILASDISPSSLQRAEAGIYPQSVLPTLPQVHRDKLTRLADGRYQVSQRLQNLIEFEERNLATGTYPRNFDLIFCRNVLIYFDDDAKDDALRRLVRSLKPGAFLFVGYSETLRDVEGLSLVQSGECSVYRRISEQDETMTNSAIQEAPQEGTSMAVGRLLSSSTLQVMLRGEYQDGTRLASELRDALAKPNNEIVVNLDGADFLGPETAGVLSQMRATARSKGITMLWQATRAGHLRFLRRHELEPKSAPLADSEPPAGDSS
jgi:chemotaxis protein methyltransferase CheR